MPTAGNAAAEAITNPIANPSLETAAIDNPTMPANWTTGSWGTNVPTFEYITNNGHDSDSSVKVTMSGYTDGDAKWIFDPISTNILQVGKQYRFTTWYKSDVTPSVVAMYLDADGNESFFGMPNPQPGADAATVWQKYSDTFSIPQGAVSVSVFMFLDKNGWLQTDDYSIEDYSPVGFNRALLTLTFDDSHEDNINTAIPLLNQYGYKSTQCYATGFIEPDTISDTVRQNIKNIASMGHEICSHTVNHFFSTALDATALNYELQHSQEYLKQLTGQQEVISFASPYGDYNASVNTAIGNYYQAHRTTDEGYNSVDNFNAYRLRVQNIQTAVTTTDPATGLPVTTGITTTPAQVKAWIDQAIADKTWLILVYHRVANNPGPYDTTIANFTQNLADINTSGVTVLTLRDALAEIKAQLGITPPVPVVKPGDVNGDDAIDALDLSIVLFNWNKTGATWAQGDLNGDGIVDALDLSTVLANWSK
jgi:peptidoglycan/xylan/chitin deacetylase (PgdA/CDA1 family)